jgi:GNAT superfamily N-acetyltransferase
VSVQTPLYYFLEMAIEIRAATLNDEEAVLDLIPQLFEPPGGAPPGYTRERGRTGFSWAVEHPDADVLLALDGDELIGLSSVYAAILSIRSGLRCSLEELIVRADRRDQGIGRELMRASIAWAKEHACTYLELTSGNGRVDAHRFYISQGMTQAAYEFMLWLAD